MCSGQDYKINPGNGGGLSYNIYQNTSEPAYIADTVFEGNFGGVGGGLYIADWSHAGEHVLIERVIFRYNAGKKRYVLGVK